MTAASVLSTPAEARGRARAVAVRQAVPALVAVILAWAMSAPGLPEAPLLPLLPMLWLLVWGLYQPQLAPAWGAFAAGLVTDLALDTPLGLHAMLMPLMAVLLRAAGGRAAGRPFWLDWLLAAPAIAAYLAAQMALMAAIGEPRDPRMIVGQAIISWAVLPLVARAAALLQARVVMR